jgi:cytochrome P450
MAALGMTHMTLRDTELGGYPIPANTPVIFNLYSSHYDETIWPNPNSFDPYRFYDLDSPDHRVADAYERINPYGLGARRCGGEALAKLEIFIFFVEIFRMCSIAQVPGEPLDPENYIFGLGLDPKPFRLIFQSRCGLW